VKPAKWIALVVTIISGAICLLIYLAPHVIAKLLLGRAVSASSADAASIGIIGGADGPTAIFVSRVSPPSFIFPVVFVLSLISWIILCYKSKKS